MDLVRMLVFEKGFLLPEDELIIVFLNELFLGSEVIFEVSVGARNVALKGKLIEFREPQVKVMLVFPLPVGLEGELRLGVKKWTLGEQSAEIFDFQSNFILMYVLLGDPSSVIAILVSE